MVVKEAHILVPGALRPISHMDAKIFEQSAAAAYHEAFGGIGEFSIKMTGNLEASVGCQGSDCKNEDFTPDQDEPAMVVLAMASLDAHSESKQSTEGKYAVKHAAFETFLCDKLRNSKSSSNNFANVNGCSVRYFKTPLKLSADATDVVE